MSELKIVANDVVVAIDYMLMVDGEIIDSSAEREPLEFLQGHGNIISGLEQEMLGMEIGESKEVVVAAIDGYGEIDPEAYIDVPRGEFPEHIPVELGVELQVQNEKGEPAYARIDKIESEEVQLNFNHPLAGKELHFSVQVIALRKPSDEEVEHGHVHDHNHEH